MQKRLGSLFPNLVHRPSMPAHANLLTVKEERGHLNTVEVYDSSLSISLNVHHFRPNIDSSSVQFLFCLLSLPLNFPLSFRWRNLGATMSPLPTAKPTRLRSSPAACQEANGNCATTSPSKTATATPLGAIGAAQVLPTAVALLPATSQSSRNPGQTLS